MSRQASAQERADQGALRARLRDWSTKQHPDPTQATTRLVGGESFRCLPCPSSFNLEWFRMVGPVEAMCTHGMSQVEPATLVVLRAVWEQDHLNIVPAASLNLDKVPSPGWFLRV